MKFTKMQGAGNDFVILDNRDGILRRSDLPNLAVRMCDRRFGVGADGLMVVEKSAAADYKMVFLNADGTFGEMCGNGARCIARYGYDTGLAGSIQRIETPSGIVTGKRIDDNRYTVRLNSPFAIDEHRAACGLDCFYTELGVPGLPHAVYYKDDWKDIPREELGTLGKKLRYSEAFPKGANVSFVKQVSDTFFEAVTYERGVEDFTFACGTGSGSIALSARILGKTQSDEIQVKMPGGLLEIRLSCIDGVWELLLTGPAETVFTGEY